MPCDRKWEKMTYTHFLLSLSPIFSLFLPSTLVIHSVGMHAHIIVFLIQYILYTLSIDNSNKAQLAHNMSACKKVKPNINYMKMPHNLLYHYPIYSLTKPTPPLLCPTKEKKKKERKKGKKIQLTNNMPTCIYSHKLATIKTLIKNPRFVFSKS